MPENKPLIDLHFTVITQPLPDFIHTGLKDYARDGNYYYHQPKILTDKLAARHDLPPEMIYLTAGIDEAILALGATFGRETVVFTPTYVVYKDVQEFGGHLTEVPSLITGQYQVETRTYPEASLIFLANPNNPVGWTAKEAVLELAKNNPQAIVVCDEAYSSLPPLNPKPLDLSVLQDTPLGSRLPDPKGVFDLYPNLVILRSFSKDYAMAGLRVGYLVAQPAVIAKIKDKVQFANVSYLSIGAAVTALAHEEYFAQMRREVVARREEFTRFLMQRGLNVLPSAINCIVIEFSSDTEGEKYATNLLANGVWVNSGGGHSNLGLPKRFVRIAIGTEEQMKKVAEIIEAMTR
ncbi:MAG: aminotransferase class I/II-fold pyridoxal phosphate-dependent enzyme [Patescibacteria group bacterium]